MPRKKKIEKTDVLDPKIYERFAAQVGAGEGDQGYTAPVMAADLEADAREVLTAMYDLRNRGFLCHRFLSGSFYIGDHTNIPNLEKNVDSGILHIVFFLSAAAIAMSDEEVASALEAGASIDPSEGDITKESIRTFYDELAVVIDENFDMDDSLRLAKYLQALKPPS